MPTDSSITFQILGKWKPPLPTHIGDFATDDAFLKKIQKKFEAVSKKLGVTNYVDLSVTARAPNHVLSDALEWHHDCGGQAHWLILWATELPTEVRCKRGKKIFQAKPYEIALINNKRMLHRSPTEIAGPNRWFARISIRFTPADFHEKVQQFKAQQHALARARKENR